MNNKEKILTKLTLTLFKEKENKNKCYVDIGLIRPISEEHLKSRDAIVEKVPALFKA